MKEQLKEYGNSQSPATPSLDGYGAPSLAKVFLKSVYYAVISSVPGLIIALYISAIFGAIAVPNLALDNIIVVQSFKTQMQSSHTFFDFLFSIIEISALRILFIVIIGFFTLWILVIILRLLNPHFSRSYIVQNNISIWRLVIFLILTFGVFFLITWLIKNISLFMAGFITSFLFWFIWHEKGIWGGFAQFKKDKTQRVKLWYISISRRTSLTLLWRVLVFSAWLYIIQMIASNIIFIYLGIMNSGITIDTHWTIFINFFLYVILGFLGGSLLLPLIYLFADTHALTKASLVKLIIPIILSGIIFVPFWKIHDFIDRYEFNKDFAQLTGVSGCTTDEYTKSVVVLSDGSYELFTYESSQLIIGLHSSFTQSGKSKYLAIVKSTLTPFRRPESSDISDMVSCSRDNLQKVETLKNHLEKQDYQTFLSMPYFCYLTENSRGACYGENWELDKLIEARFLSFEKTNNLFNGLTLISFNSAFAQVKPLYIETLNKLQDESIFHIGAGVFKQLGDLYLHYGLVKQAEKLYEKARLAGYDDSSDPIPNLTSYIPRYSDGKITGKILINGQPLKGVKVGLLVDEGEVREKAGKKPIGIRRYFDGPQKPLVAATITDSDGTFIFDRVLADEYYLGIMFNDDMLVDKEKLNIIQEKPVTKIIISKDTPIADLGKIDISF